MPRSGVFPDELNLAKVGLIHIFKSGDSAQISNYRPVSVFPFIQKSLNVLCMLDYSFYKKIWFII